MGLKKKGEMFRLNTISFQFKKLRYRGSGQENSYMHHHRIMHIDPESKLLFVFHSTEINTF